MSTEVLRASQSTPQRESHKFSSCVGHVAILSKNDNNRAVKSFPISASDSTKITFGWNEECSIRIVLPEVSGVHAAISVRSGKALLENLSSTNPLLLNGKTLSGRETLKIGDVFSIGGRLFRFDLNPMSKRSKSSSNATDENKAPNPKTPSKTPSKTLDHTPSNTQTKPTPSPLSTRQENLPASHLPSSTPVKFDGEFKVPNFTPRKLNGTTPKPSQSSATPSSIPRLHKPVNRQGTPIRIPAAPSVIPPSIVKQPSTIPVSIPTTPISIPVTPVVNSTNSTDSIDSSNSSDVKSVSPSKVPTVNQWATPLKLTPPVEQVLPVPVTPTQKPQLNKGSKTEFVQKNKTRESSSANSVDISSVKNHANKSRSSIGNGKYIRQVSRNSFVPVITPIKSSTGIEDVPPDTSITDSFHVPVDSLPSEEPKAAPTPKTPKLSTPKVHSTPKPNQTPNASFTPKPLQLSESPLPANTPKSSIKESATQLETPKEEVKQLSFSPAMKLTNERKVQFSHERRKSTTNIEIKQVHDVETVFNTIATPAKKRKNRRSRKHKTVPITLSAQKPPKDSFICDEIDEIFSKLEKPEQPTTANKVPSTPVSKDASSTPIQTPQTHPQTPKVSTPRVQPKTPIVSTPKAQTAVVTPKVQPQTPKVSTPRVEPTTPIASTPKAQSAVVTPRVQPTTPIASTPKVQPTPRALTPKVESQLTLEVTSLPVVTPKATPIPVPQSPVNVQSEPTQGTPMTSRHESVSRVSNEEEVKDVPQETHVVKELEITEAPKEPETVQPTQVITQVITQEEMKVEESETISTSQPADTANAFTGDFQEEFKRIFHVIREALDSDGERRSKKLFRLPTKQSKAGKQYYEIVKNPIDLQTISKKINSSEISSIQEFRELFERLFANALLYNQQSVPDSNLVENVTFLQNTFVNEIAVFSRSTPSVTTLPPQQIEKAEESVKDDEENKETKASTPKQNKRGRGKKQKVAEVAKEPVKEIAKETVKEPVKEEQEEPAKEIVQEEQEEKPTKGTRKQRRGKAEEASEKTEVAIVSEKPKGKKETTVPSLTEEEIQAMKVTELKAELKKRGLQQSGLKAELIQRLISAVSQN